MKRNPHAVIVVEGGVVAEVYSTQRNLNFIVLDHDNAADLLYDSDDEIAPDRAIYDPKMKYLKKFKAKYARVTCCACLNPCLARKAHRHQGNWIGDECCWDEKLRTSE